MNRNPKLSGTSRFFILLQSSDASDLERAAASLDYNKRNQRDAPLNWQLRFV